MRIVLNLAFLLVLSADSFAAEEYDCSKIHDDLIYCPVPVATSRTELKQGFVEVEYTVNRDGTVSDTNILQADEYGMWNDTALKTIATWKYMTGDTASVRKYRFNFAIEE